MPLDATYTQNRPEPLVGSHIDVRDLDGFMFNVERLLASELWALTKNCPEAFRGAVGLWARAWKQFPAASLPNDDNINAAFADLPLAKFKRHRALIMRGFVLCSDNRFYHRTLAEEALRAFEKKKIYQKKRKDDADRLRKWRADRAVGGGEWDRIRFAVFQRDGEACVKCGSTEDLHCDHIIEAANGGPSEMENLATLCRSCHSRKTALQRHF